MYVERFKNAHTYKFEKKYEATNKVQPEIGIFNFYMAYKMLIKKPRYVLNSSLYFGGNLSCTRITSKKRS